MALRGQGTPASFRVTPLAAIVRSAVVIVVLLCASLVGAQEAPLPGIADLRQRLASVEQSGGLSTAQKAEITALYRLAISRIEAAERFEDEARAYTQALLDLPRERQRLRAEQQAYRAPKVGKDFEKQAPGVVEQALLEAVGAEAILRTKLARVQSSVQSERALALKQLLSTAQEGVDKVDAAARAVGTSEPADEAEAAARAAAKRLALARIEALSQRLASRPARLALMEAEADLLAEQLVSTTDYIAALQALLSRVSKAGVSALVSRLEAHLQSLGAAPEDLRRFAEVNIRLARSVDEILARRQQAEAESARLRGDVSLLNSKLDTLDRLLNLNQIDPSAAFGIALRQERDKASDAINIDSARAAAEGELEASRIALFQLEEKRPPYDLPSKAALEKLLRGAAPDWGSAIDTLLEQRRSLITRLKNEQARYADELSALLTQLKYFSERSHTWRDALESHLFWIPSAQPMGTQTLRAAAESVAWLAEAAHWRDVRQAVATNLDIRLPGFLAGLALLLLAIASRGWLKRRLQRMASRIGNVQSDHLALTLEAFAITAVLALPPGLLLFGLAYLVHSPTGFARSLETALTTSAVLILFMEFILQLVRSNGVAAVHFSWSRSTLTLLRRNTRRLMLLFVPITIVMVLVSVHAAPEIRDGLGRISLILLCVAIAWIASRLWRLSRLSLAETDGDNWLWYIVYLWYPALMAIALAMIVLSLLGYHYTASQLLRLTMHSILLVTMATLVHATLERAFAVFERRLMLARASEAGSESSARSIDRHAAQRAADAIPEDVQGYEIDRRTISRQSRALLRLIVLVGVAFGMASIWQGLLPAVRTLDEIVLWRMGSGDGTLAPQVVTLWSLIVAATVFTIAIIAIRNLPGALEVAVLSRFNLAPGTGYAITMLLNYLIVLVSLLAASNLLGIDWSKLQWLIAALGVGLGFGLQEIVANFVSGIVILFERPFRVGDIVTIAGHTGTVTRIHIRATTISDWDRKELLIPNKTFITQDCINWTLSDPITRLIVPLGVEYGSDTEQVVDTLMEVAGSNESVCDEPAPAALFLRFGESSLEFELRVFTRLVLYRSIVTHELHMAIDKAFRERGITMSYPQRDVHLSTDSPLEVLVKAPASEPGAPS
ncbi:MAG: Potassium efflux system KefA precursor [Candidatus Accumulibacter regalis]|jgi:small-conductance mechanosensitive channel|uniref:Potassium efflux system KefA n=1 Tax=Accumulibacter regalis TaxID=522306 RepID=A0A011PJ17_ACCRE|nr:MULTISPECIES: mechanosensitive ion channel domain-containing protein [unclassified Candidatus Accumulibacter]EXI87496.1 MAG: Potassium efflux system KefA precursor [Candidatus Accumulibacter regalis]MBL8369627.1 mechanosensitive ion channel [Accumulibacter sp.]MBN8515186.1 mechanosensitive ion channel [Accumulibacter sp.]HRE70795.1 mechanosensitive ion channel [Accumulibacter sp.]HRE85896.1 mechanosensitive ion channel [Accumulibacter sp.]